MVLCSALALTVAAPVFAQNPTGTISGRVIDSTGLAAPGATVTATSPQLQGERRTVTSTDGDYLLALLPPGRYTVVFALSGFASVERTVDVAPTETVNLGATLQPAGVTEVLTVTGTDSSFVNTVQSATNVKQDLTSRLPTARTLLSAINLAPSVHLTGPSNNISIGGAMSFENLIMLNGVQIQDNLRGSPFALFIEDAIQETTIATAGISAEYGRFSGGVVNAITKSGGNTFGGSYRVTFNNDNWRTVSPFGEPKTDDTVPTHEYTFGGPILRDRTWFFVAGRTFDQSTAQQTGFTNVPYVNEIQEDRYEIKITQSLGTDQTIKGGYTAIRRDELNNVFPSPNLVMDTRSFVSRQLPQDLLSLHYSGLYGSKLFLEGQYSQRMFAFENSGGTNTDLIEGTLLLDQQTGATWWAPAFCGVCVSEQRDNQNLLLKGNYFLTRGRGAHQLTFGYDWFNDKRRGDNHQSASDWHIWTTTSTIVDGEVFPVVAGNGSTWIINWPILLSSQGTNFRTHSLFLNDNWQVSGNLTVNLGLRWDKNQGQDAAGADVVRDSAFSPRLGMTWDPRGDGVWSVNTSYGRYVAAIANSIADSASPAGTPATFAWFYLGPNINTGGGPLQSSPAVIQSVFDWFNANGGQSRDTFFADVPGVATRIRDGLRSPHADEYVVGVSRQLGSRGAIRADFTYRNFGDFYSDLVDPTTGTVTDELGRTFDVKLVQNTNKLDRRYAGLSLQSTYRVSSALQVGGSYTLSRLWGNINGENIRSGPLTSSIESYAEFFDPAWSFPEGDLLADQRHRLRFWALYDVLTSERWGTVNVSLLQQAESGTPYGAVGSIETAPFVLDPGYRQPPATVDYFFTARDAFHTEAQLRSDIAVNYERAIPGAARARFFARFDVLNLFDQFQLFNIGTGAINTTVLTAFDDPDRFQMFDPFTETPVQGVHWDVGEDFGTPTGAAAYTLPRTFRFNIGVRF
jgi:outer membrane receptor protein involved in Fe transport